MSSFAAYSAVRTYFLTYWDVGTTPIVWDNEQSKPPTGTTEWLFISEDDSEFDQISIGSGSPTLELWRETGGVLIQINVEAGVGTQRASQIVSLLRDFMLGLELPSDIRFDSMPTLGRGQHEDGNWYGIWLRAGWIRN